MRPRPDRPDRPARAVRAVLPVAVVLALGACSSTSQSSADYPWYEDLPALLDAADLVVVGTSTGSRPDVDQPEPASGGDPQLNPQAGTTPDAAEPADESADEGVPITVHTVEIADVLVGDAPGRTIEVAVTRGSASDGKDLDGLGEMMLFLQTSDGPAYVVGGPQGVLVAAPEGEYASAVDGLATVATTPDEVRRLAGP